MSGHDLARKWAEGDWINAIFKPFVDLLGASTVGTVLGASLVVSFYIYSDDLALPTVVLLLLSGVIISVLPGDIAMIAHGFLVVATGSALLEAARRYVL